MADTHIPGVSKLEVAEMEELLLVFRILVLMRIEQDVEQVLAFCKEGMQR